MSERRSIEKGGERRGKEGWKEGAWWEGGMEDNTIRKQNLNLPLLGWMLLHPARERTQGEHREVV